MQVAIRSSAGRRFFSLTFLISWGFVFSFAGQSQASIRPADRHLV